MFRDPRENANKSIEAPVIPSTGRPPTPPDSKKPPNQTLSTMTTPSSTKPLTPRPNSKSNVPALGRQGTKKAANGKTPSKANNSILNFFKKVDSPIKDDSIFLSESPQAGNVTAQSRAGSINGSYADTEDLYAADEEDCERYNEATGAVKRRKVSIEGVPDAKIAANEDAMNERSVENSDMVVFSATSAACSPPPPEITKSSKPKSKPKKSRTGPFLSDSDSDEYIDDQKVQADAVNAEKRELRTRVSKQPPEMNEMVETLPVEQEEISENWSIVPLVDSVVTLEDGAIIRRKKVPIAQAQGKWEALQPKSMSRESSAGSGKASGSGTSSSTKDLDENTTVPPVPALKKEATSMDEWGQFDGIEDFPDYEEFGEGEEFIERKWMEEQARLEAEEAGEFDGFSYDGRQNVPVEEGITAACPICDASLTGVTSDQATMHVNACLDGNPIPLPGLVRNEPAEGKMMPAVASNRFARKAAVPRPGQANPFDFGSSGAKQSSAFSKLMSGHAEDAAWANAAASEHAARGKPAYQRTCPFYKIMPGFYICVDAFRYGAVQGCNAYFLSHFHSDHYVGLTSSWCHGPIYCSKVTANLVKQQLRVDPKWVVDLNFEERFEVPGTEGVAVTMIPANHCPGSSLYLFEKIVGRGVNPKIQRVLHCGDFRACPAHIDHPLLIPDIVDSISGKTKQQKIDVCYLDTTYLNPRYAFPSQEAVTKACADMCVSLKKERAEESDAWEVVKRERAGAGMAKFVNSTIKAEDDSIAMEINNSKPRGRLLVICGTYSIGKERICMGIARALDCKIWAPPGKMRICAALEDPELMSRMTTDPREAQIHMQMLMEIRAETLQEYLNGYKPHFSRIVGFRPSGWNYRPPNSRFTDSPLVSTVLHSENWKSQYSMAELVPQRGSTREASCFGVPYSEHSSFRELTMFVCALRIEKIVPTVNVGSATGRAKMKAWIERWLAERRKNGCVKLGKCEGEVRW